MRHPLLTVRMVVASTIVFGFYALFAVAAHAAGFGLTLVLGASLLFVALQYKLGTWLAVRGANAEEMPPDQFPEVHRRVDRLCEEMDLPKPRLMVGEMGAPNAFAVGRKGAGTVVVSRSLLELLDTDELEGVLAHELAHIRNRDVVVMVLGQSVASILGIVVFWVVALADDNIGAVVLGWILSSLVNALVLVFVLAISRYREYVADGDAVEATGDPDALGRALVKIANVSRSNPRVEVDDSVAALCIFGDGRGLLARLFSTHPPIERRVEKLSPRLLE